MTSGSSGNDALLQAIKRLEDNMEEKMATMKRELVQEIEQADERLVKRMKLEKAPTFKRKSHEVQFRFKEEVASKFAAVKSAARETPPAVERVIGAAEEGEKVISERNKLIRIADRSEYGWDTVEEYQDDELAADSDDEKKLFKAEARAGRKRRIDKSKTKKPYKKPGAWWQKIAANSNMAAGTSVGLGGQVKCRFSQRQVPFLGQVVDETGIKPDPSKVAAIRNVPVPTNVGDIRRFLGAVNQMIKFALNLAEVTKPLRDLLVKGNQWVWGEAQQRAFEEVKRMLTTTPVLALFDPQYDTTLSADASSYGLGAVLLQRQPGGQLKPVSRSMTATEQRYAQIEKEALAPTWACERFSDYLIGLKFHIHTDHNPLVPLFSTKRLDELPLRVQRFRLRMLRYHFTISHIPGKDLVIADMLSRAPTSTPSDSDLLFYRETSVFVDAVVQSVPASDAQLERIKREQEQDDVCKQIIVYCRDSWPEKHELTGAIRPYYPVKTEIAVANGLLL